MYQYIILDDEYLTRKATIEKLAPLSELVQCIGEGEDGQEGLGLIDTLHPDIVITDMKMPLFGGDRLLPILAEKYPDIFIIVISGYQDFDYAHQAMKAGAVDYILKPFSSEEIQHVMQKVLDQLTHKQKLRNQKLMIEQYETTQFSWDRELLRNMIEGYASPSSKPSSPRLLTLYQNRDYMLITLYTDNALPKKEVQGFLSKNGYGDTILFLPHSQTDHMGYLLISLPPVPSLDNRAYCQQILRGISSLFWPNHWPVLYGCSAVHCSLSNLSAAHRETLQALDNCTLSQKENILFYSLEKDTVRLLEWERTNELLFYIESGKTDETEALLEELFTFFEGQPSASLLDVKYSCHQLTDQLRYMMSHHIQQVHKSQTESGMQPILDTIYSIQRLKEFYLRFFLNIASAFVGQGIYSDQDTMQNVKTYIDHHYQKNISVEFVASLFHLNRSYLSHAFRQKMGHSFIDYLNLVRVSHAKELLEKSDKKMYQITKLAGYNNLRYFFRAFKKSEGMTPDQYRKSYCCKGESTTTL